MSEVWVIPSQLIVDSDGEVKLLSKGERKSLYVLYLGKSHEKNSHMQVYPVSLRTLNKETGYYTAYSIVLMTKHYRMTENGTAKISLYRLLHMIATESGAINSSEPFPKNEVFKWDAEVIIEVHSSGSCAWLYIYPNKDDKNTAFCITMNLIGNYQYFKRTYLYEDYWDENCSKISYDNLYFYLAHLRNRITSVPIDQSAETIFKYN